ncbi:MAG: Ig-like domain-containing protein [Lachnospiraceae bacterium]|nr:Ig-like domain-containing protein [Lachnospiraceae bacterium]
MKKSIFKIKAVLYAAVLLGGLQLGMTDMAHAAQTTDGQEYPVSENWLKPAEIQECESDTSLKQRSAAYAVSYDPRNVNGIALVTPIRDQGIHNTCWAFAATGAVEGNLIKNGYADSSVDLSENHFAYFFYNRQTDKLGYTKNDANKGGNSWDQNGGSLRGSGLALMTWAGMTTESKSPYVSIPDKSMCYQDDYVVKDLYYYNYNVKNLNNSVNTIKQAIMDHGAVASGIYFDYRDKNGYYNSKTGAYYCNKVDGNHAVTIVGWDDNYSRNNFGTIKPSKNGAWIVKNSYGTEFGDKGYNYVSYEDASLAEMMAVEAVPVSEQYDNNYQHDGSANPVAYISLDKQVRCANVFKAKASSTYTELLKAVGICTYSTNTSYEIQIYTGLSSAGKPTSGTKAFSSAVKGTFKNAGYQTVELPKAVSLVPGEYFSIVVTLKTSSGKPRIAVDVTDGYGWIGFNAAVSKNQSFLYHNNKWLDGKEIPDGYGTISCNFRIKGYTDKTNVKPSITLSKNLGISKGSSTKLSLKKNPGNIYRTVTWKSSNTKVASVNSKGTVKGINYGTATISATFVKSSKKTTLKCKVTVGPSKLKNVKVKASKGKVTVSWKKNSAANGYEVYYSTNEDSGYKKLATVKGSKAKVTKKLKSGTYYVKMRAYRSSGKKKLYGSYTVVKKVTVK